MYWASEPPEQSSMTRWMSFASALNKYKPWEQHGQQPDGYTISLLVIMHSHTNAEGSRNTAVHVAPSHILKGFVVSHSVGMIRQP